MTLTKLLALALVSSLLPGCASIGPIEMSGDPAALPAFRTFRVHEEQFAFATDISDAQRAQVSTQLRQAAVRALDERGYQEVSGNADVLVTLGAISRPVLNTESEPHSGHLQPVDTSVFDTGRSDLPQSEVMPAGVGREGDLILYLLDPATQRALWRASASGSATTPSEALRRARATYAEMVAKLPRASGGPAK
jgi:Domain of unknown function (DUF4136)